MQIQEPQQLSRTDGRERPSEPLSSQVQSVAAHGSRQGTQTASGAHPMGAISSWMRDFAIFGCVSGLVGGPFIARGAAGLGALQLAFIVLFFTALVGIQGLLAGLAVGSVLRVLRGRVPAVLGLGVAVMVAWLATSLVPWLAGKPIDLGSTIGGLPYTLAVTALIPWTAVRRARKQSTLPWVVGAGVFIGLIIHPWGEWVKVLWPGV